MRFWWQRRDGHKPLRFADVKSTYSEAEADGEDRRSIGDQLDRDWRRAPGGQGVTQHTESEIT